MMVLLGDYTWGVMMRKRIAILVGAGALSIASVQSLSMAIILGAGMVAVTPGLTSNSAHAGTALLPGWRYPCSNCLYTWRGGAPFRDGRRYDVRTYNGRTHNRATYTVRTNLVQTNTDGRGNVVRTTVVRTTVVRSYIVRPNR